MNFNPDLDGFDRMVNYGMALEAALVPEKDFVSARLKQRALGLLDWESSEAKASAKKMLDLLQDTRSTIAHGSIVGAKTVQLLQTNRIAVESLVRRLLSASIKRLPADDANRRSVLDGLYAVVDEKRVDDLVDKFRTIKNPRRPDLIRKNAAAPT